MTQKFISCLTLFLTCGIMAACCDQSTAWEIKPSAETEFETETETETDWSQWNGTWQLVSGKFAGNDMPEVLVKTMSLTINDGNFEIKSTQLTETGKLVLVESNDESKPKELQINTESGPNAGKKLSTIYRFKDGNLTICYSINGKRPEEFVTNQENGFLLLEYKKQEDQ